MMKYATGAMITLLAGGGPWFMADLYTITLASGTILYWCAGDASVTVGANTFTSSTDQGTQPVTKRGAARLARGLEVATLDVTLFTGDTAQLLGIDANLAAINGIFDGARVRLDRAIMPTWGDTSAGTIALFEGLVAGVDPGSTQVVLHVASDLDRLQANMPRVLFLDHCPNVFGDAACGMSRASLTSTGTAASGTDGCTVQTGITTHAAGYYTGGVLTMTSGLGAGSSRSITGSTALGAVTVAVPLPDGVTAGDGFSVCPGCARTQAACTAWGNIAQFRGCPYIPVAETAR